MYRVIYPSILCSIKYNCIKLQYHEIHTLFNGMGFCIGITSVFTLSPRKYSTYYFTYYRAGIILYINTKYVLWFLIIYNAMFFIILYKDIIKA